MGCLFGVIYNDGTLLVLGFNLETTIGQLNYKQIQHKFPAEIDLCGLINFGDCSDSELHIKEILQDVDITDNPILLNCGVGTLVDLKASVFMHGKLQDIPYDIVPENELFNDFSFTRLRCNLNLLTEKNCEKIIDDMQKLRKTLAGGSLVFRIKNTKIFLTGKKYKIRFFPNLLNSGHFYFFYIIRCHKWSNITSIITKCKNIRCNNS